MTVWAKKSLGEVAKLRSGIGFPRDLQGRSEQKYPFAKVGDISAVARAGDTAISGARNAVSQEDLETLRAAPFPAGTIAFAKIGEAISQNFRVVTTCPMLLDNNVMGVIPDPRQVDTRYLLRYLQSLDFYALAGKTAVPAIRKSILERVNIPLPPLPEQRRIAAILDKADAVRRKRQQTLDLADQFLRSTFLDMFGDPVTNPKDWEMTTLPGIAMKFTDGPFGSNLKSSHYVKNGVRVIRLQNIGVGEMLLEDLAFISREHYDTLPRNHCKPGDVIIGTLGDPNLRACIVPEVLNESLNKADCLLMRVDSALAENQYICSLLNCEPLVNQSRRLVRGQTRGRISLGRLKELRVPLPPLDLQRRFAEIVESFERQKVHSRAHLAESETLFLSLQQSAFRGEL